MTTEKIHTTNYTNTFIHVADDCSASAGEIPPAKGEAKSVATMQFEMIAKHPYKFTSDEVLFTIHAERNDIPESARSAARKEFFAKGQACLRASPLAKRYGWGIHHDAESRVALVGRESEEYERLAADASVKSIKAMKSSK
jgi:hypothetical protein